MKQRQEQQEQEQQHEQQQQKKKKKKGEGGGEDEEQKQQLARQEKQRILHILYAHVTFGVMTCCVPIQAEPMLFNAIAKSDVVVAARLLSSATACMGLFEFLVNPTIGKLTDSFGRKPFMLIGPTVQMIANLFVVAKPTSLPIVFANRFVTGACSTLSGSVTSVSAMSDLCSGAELGMNIATLWAYAGLGVIIGPLVGGQIIARTGNPCYVYLLKSLMGAIHLCFTYTNMVETLPLEKRRKFTWNVTNPFAFYRLFVGEQSTPTLRKLVSSAMFSSWAEGKNTNDVTQMIVREDVQMSESSISYFVTLYGIVMYTGGKYLVPSLIKTLGVRGFSSFSSACVAVAWGLMGLAPTAVCQFLGLLVLFPGINANSSAGIRGLATDHAVAAGFGRGEYSGLFSNLRASTVALAPITFGTIYAWLRRNNYSGGYAYLAVSIIGGVVPELLHRAISNKDLGT
jgi:MFS family permease